MDNIKKLFLDFLDNDIKKGNIKKIPQSIFDRILVIKRKVITVKNKGRCQECNSLNVKDVMVETQPYGFHDAQKLCKDCILNKNKLLNS